MEQNKLVLSHLSELEHNHIRFGDNWGIKEVIEKNYDYSIKKLLDLREKSQKIRRKIAEIDGAIKKYNRKHS